MTRNGPRGAYIGIPTGQAPATLGTWRENAACTGADPELFFPHPTDRVTAQRVIDTYCATCPVQTDCLADGHSITDSRTGIWGGTQLDRRGGPRDPAARGTWTHAQMRAANTAHDAWRNRGGPELTEEQQDARRAYQRALLAVRRQQRRQEREVAS